MSDATLDLTPELTRLLNFTASVAIAIRMNSAYNSQSAHSPNTPHDVMWLADSLHNFDMLGRAIESGEATNIEFACDQLLRAYESYTRTDTGLKSEPNATFERNAQRVTLKEAQDIFRDIKTKVRGYV